MDLGIMSAKSGKHSKKHCPDTSEKKSETQQPIATSPSSSCEVPTMDITIPTILKGRKIGNEPNWSIGVPGGTYGSLHMSNYANKDGLADLPVQQIDMLKPLYMDIVRHGLPYAYEQSKDKPYQFRHVKASQKPKKVIIVGAGMAGLAAAYELRRAGHTVQILEMQERVGGRVKTFGEKDGFAKGLYVDGGAMRLPNPPESKKEKTHYLTDYYAKTKFDLPLVPFNNSDDNTFLKFYNMAPMPIKDWKINEYQNFCDTWPGWDSKICDNPNIRNISINDYYNYTSKFVTDQLRKRLVGTTTLQEKSTVWDKWIDNWSRFSLNGYLRSTAAEVRSKLDEDYRRDIIWNHLDKLIPWPEEAITAYSVYNYTEQLDQCLVQFLRHELGEWSSDDMHCIDGGMSKLPECFYDLLKEDITFNITVNEIEYTATTKDDVHVKVKGYFSTSGQPCCFDGDAAIVTTPLHIIRQIKMTSTGMTPEFPSIFYQAIEDVWYEPSTKIMIQTRTRFWDKPDDENGIKGGFSKTNLPIGQLHYPTAPEAVPRKGVDPKIAKLPQKGILLVYTWKSEALQFGALHPQIAIHEAVRQIGEIHEEIKDEFEVGAVQAWYNEPSAQGAYVLLKPHQYRNIARLWNYPFLNIFFAGEGISFAAGWIEGALGSGLRAAYQFYARNEEDKLHIVEQKS